MCGAREILLKSWKKPHNRSPILAPTAGTPGNPGKTSQFADHPLDRRKSWKKTSQYYGFACWLLLSWLVPTSCAEAPCGGKNVRDKGNPIEKCAGHPLDLRKSWKKPHNLCPIPGTRENPGKNLTILRICLVGCWLLVGCRQAVQRPPAGANKS